MADLKKSLFYFPTTVLFVDDDPSFLSNIGFEIDSKIPLLFCSKPRLVPEILNENRDVSELIKKHISYVEAADSDLPVNGLMKIDVDGLQKEMFNKNRFSFISVLVIDYSMPGMNGAELCESLKDTSVKKIMLTGAADYNIAVKLFNDGLIDNFIVKDSPEMVAQLSDAISKAQINYFESASSSFIGSIANELSCLNEPSFWQFISKFFNDNKFSELYLVDNSGSFLFVDFYGVPTWVTVRSGQELEGFHDIAVDNEAPAEIVSLLSGRKVLPFFLTEQDRKAPVSAWGNYLHDSMPLPGLGNYYYAVINSNDAYSLDKKSFLSHKDFLQKNK